MNEILDEVRAQVGRGVSEFQIIAQELTCYGTDIYGRSHIAELIDNIAKIKGVDTIEDAERLRGKTVYINRDDINLGEGVHFVQDLLGLEIRDADSGKVYGTLTDVLRTGANDVYEITDSDGKKYLAPVIDEVVIEINTDGGYVLLRPMKGIFDDED